MSKFLWSTFGLKLKYWIFIFWRYIWGCFNSLRVKLGKIPKSQPSGMIVTFNIRVFVRQTLTRNTFKSFGRKCLAVCCRMLFGDCFRKIIWSQKRSHLFVFIGWKQARTATVELMRLTILNEIRHNRERGNITCSQSWNRKRQEGDVHLKFFPINVQKYVVQKLVILHLSLTFMRAHIERLLLVMYGCVWNINY